MKVTYFGYLQEPLLAVLESGIEVIRVFVEPKRSRTNDMLKFCDRHRLAVTEIAEWKKAAGEVLPILTNSELGLVGAFGGIFTPKMISAPRYGLANIHFSYLPEYRGNNPIEWMILNGEKSGGVTVHWIASEIDRGAIIAQERVPIEEEDTYEAVYRRCADSVYRLTQSVFSRPLEAWPRKPQEIPSGSSYLPLRRKEDARIRAGDRCKAVLRLLRAEGWKGIVHFTCEGRLLHVLSAMPDPAFPRTSGKGHISAISPAGIRLDLEDGSLLLEIKENTGKLRPGLFIDD